MFTYGFVQEPGVPGQDGASAYQIAVANGFVGTEQEWLASLVGAGLPAGGTEGQMIVKASDNDYDTTWIDNFTDTLRAVCKNDSGDFIPKATVVMAVGATGDQIRIAPAVSDGSVAAQYMLGVTTQDIENGTDGYVALLGPIPHLNTLSYPVGTILYIDPSAPGAFTTTAPVAPALDLAVAIVTRQHNESGRVFVRMWSQGQRLGELYDVSTLGATEGSTLVLSNTGVWLPGVPTGGSFTFVQETPSATWTVVHNMGFYPNVTTEDPAGDGITGAVLYVDANTVVIDFNTPVAGTAYLS